MLVVNVQCFCQEKWLELTIAPSSSCAVDFFSLYGGILLRCVRSLPSLYLATSGNSRESNSCLSVLCYMFYMQIGLVILVSHVISHVITVSIDPGYNHVRNKSDEATEYYCAVCQVNV